MILRISYIKTSCRIKGHTPRIAESSPFCARTADGFQPLIVGIENLDPAVPEFAHILPSSSVDADVVRITELSFRCACFAVLTYEFTLAGKNLNPMIARICHEDAILCV